MHGSQPGHREALSVRRERNLLLARVNIQQYFGAFLAECVRFGRCGRVCCCHLPAADFAIHTGRHKRRTIPSQGHDTSGVSSSKNLDDANI